MFCENLRKIREERQLTKKQMSDLIGIPYTTYVGYETLVREPKNEQIQKIAEALKLPPAYILGLDQEDENYKQIELDEDGKLKMHLLTSFNKLNLTGKLQSIEVVESFTHVPRYTEKE